MAITILYKTRHSRLHGSDDFQFIVPLLQVYSFILARSAYVMFLSWWMHLPLRYPPHPPHSP